MKSMYLVDLLSLGLIAVSCEKADADEDVAYQAVKKSPGHWEYWYWNGDLEALCEQGGAENCAVYIYEGSPAINDGLSGALLTGDVNDIDEYLNNTSDGLSIPIPSSDRADLSDGTMEFYPVADGADYYYRYK